MSAGNYDWVNFYMEFADKLIDYSNNRTELVKKIQKLYENTGINMPKLHNIMPPPDIDPFTVFGLFNKQITDANRIKLLTEIKKLFDVKANVPTNFSGIPVLDNRNATFYNFPGPGVEKEMEILWGTFISAIRFGDDETNANRNGFIGAFNTARLIKRNRWKLTMGLYWVRPYTFINLDSRNRWFINQPGTVTEKCADMVSKLDNIPEGEEYLHICDAFKEELSNNDKYNNFVEFSASAWIVSKEDDEKEKALSVKKDNTLGDNSSGDTRYWIYSPGEGAEYWDEFRTKGIMAIGWDAIGDLSLYSSKEEMRLMMKEKIDPSVSFKVAALGTWQFANDMKPGDIVFAKRGRQMIVGKGIVESDYYRDDSREHDKNVRKVKWINSGDRPLDGPVAMKTLTDVTSYVDFVQTLNSFYESDTDDDVEEKEVLYPEYNENDFLNEVYMTEEDYENLVALVRNKKNVILQGAPGVGKTFAAKRLAYSMMGEKDQSRVMMIQFHQSYSYEDFIMGFRPTQEGGFVLKPGAFYNFCKAAEIDSENEYFFIIDEINRGNLSKIFGELFMLIENDKRGIQLQLLYSDEKFSVPKNVYIIGMMNTADRSLAMLDYALRRRFAFFDMKPGFETDGFRNYKAKLNSSKFDNLINYVESLNTTIADDESLGEGFCIGHSYFCNLDDTSDQTLNRIVEFELIPLLKEYWFDEPVKVKNWASNLRSAIK